MKKIITDLPGEHPLSLNDFQHMQDSYTEIIDALVKSQTSGNTVRLHGVAVSSPSSDASCTAGAIYHDGEVYQVDAHSITGNGTLSWEVVETYGPGNPVTFKDGTSNNVHVIRKLRMTYGTGIFPHGDLGDMPTYALQSSGSFTSDFQYPRLRKKFEGAQSNNIIIIDEAVRDSMPFNTDNILCRVDMRDFAPGLARRFMCLKLEIAFSLPSGYHVITWSGQVNYRNYYEGTTPYARVLMQGSALDGGSKGSAFAALGLDSLTVIPRGNDVFDVVARLSCTNTAAFNAFDYNLRLHGCI